MDNKKQTVDGQNWCYSVTEDIEELHSQAQRLLKKRKLPWFATTGAVIITTLFCAGFDGSNIYLSLASQTRDNVVLTVILAVGTTFLMNFSCTILGDMYKRYVQKIGNIKRWMMIAFFIFLSTLFISVFAFRYGNADAPFVSNTVNMSLAGGDLAVQDDAVPAIIKYSLATIINISSIVSSFLCFVIGFYNSDPESDKMAIDIKKLSGFIKLRAILYAKKAKCTSDTEESMNEFEAALLEADKKLSDSESRLRKVQVREIMVAETAEDSEEAGDIIASSKNICSVNSPVEEVEDVSGYEEEIPEEPYEDDSVPTQEAPAECSYYGDVVDLFRNVPPILPPRPYENE